MISAIEKINDLKKMFPRKIKCLNKEEYEFRNMLITAELIAQSALLRKESRGAHYRTDYPQMQEESIHSIMTINQGVTNFVK